MFPGLNAVPDMQKALKEMRNEQVSEWTQDRARIMELDTLIQRLGASPDLEVLIFNARRVVIATYSATVCEGEMR